LLLGTAIGAAFGPDVLAPLKAALLPMIVLTGVINSLGLALGWALARITPLDSATALISAVPGGLPAMVAFADDAEADATVVAAIHLFRLTIILVLMPVLIPLLTTASASPPDAAAMTQVTDFWPTAITLLGGLAGGLLALRLGMPTGDLIGPILLVGGVNLLGMGPGPLAESFRTAAMLFIGVAVGAQMSRESLGLLRRVAPAAAAVIATLISAGLALGWGLAHVTSLDLTSALLSSLPGGASAMAAVAGDLGGDMRLVAALHLTRQLTVFVLAPTALSYLLHEGHRKRVGLVGRR
jgi:membrane AbrB-like protein